MEWNPTSLTPAAHPPGSLTLSEQYPHHHHHHHLHQTQSGILTNSTRKDFYPTTTSTALSSAGILQNDDLDDRRPSTPRNSSPAVLNQEFGEDDFGDENHDDLLVFGYGCKIFRDDERAQWIEEQKHLIPWMGHSDLLIDRYDCRGALMDIARFEPGSSYNNLQEDQDDSSDLNSSYEQEKLLEKELDEERYKELNEDVDYDEGAYDKAGDYRKLQTAMNGMLSESHHRSNDESRNYAAFQYNYDEQSHDICIGPEPKRVQEEDAPYTKPIGLYIPEEIILPATMKVHAIIEKTAKFIASQSNQMEIILKTKQASNPLFDFLNHGGILNPYYKFLVHTIRSGIYRPTEQDEGPSRGANVSSEYSGSEEDLSEHHGYLHPSLFRTSTTSSSSLPSSIDYTGVGSSTSGKHNAYTMLVSKIKGTDSPDPVSQQQQQQQQQQISNVTPFTDYQQNNSNQGIYSTMYGYGLSGQQAQQTQQQQQQVPRPQKKLPSTSDQLIIEKMASYVIKNGANFEVLAKNKSDPRFGFLNPSHEYHWYYLNCKERFKAESSAVVAKSDFVNYYNSGSSSASSSTTSSPTKPNTTLSTASSIKKSAVAAELAELKRKNSGLLAKKDGGKDKTGSLGGTGPSAENVFSQVNLVSKDKDKPVIRFSTSLSVTNVTSTITTPSTAVPVKDDLKVEKSSTPEVNINEDQLVKGEVRHQLCPKLTIKTSGVDVEPVTAAKADVEEEEEGEIKDDEEGSADSDLYLLEDDNAGIGAGGNSTPASEDDEVKVRRRMERKRKATLFLQKLKMAKSTLGGGVGGGTDPKLTSEAKPKPVPLATGNSLGDLLNRRLQTTEAAQERINAQNSQQPQQQPPEITISDSEDNGREDRVKFHNNGGDDSKSSSSSRHSSRSRSRSHRNSRKKRRRRSRSYTSSGSGSSSSASSSYDGSSRSYSRKKSSKKKRKKKKKKYEKSSRSSHKSKRR